MNKPPVCRLCKCGAYTNGNRTTCPNHDCAMYCHWFDVPVWNKLMHIPERKDLDKPYEFRGHRTFDRGYNAAIDNLEMGGP